MVFKFPVRKNICVLALGAESAGNFSVFRNGKLYLSPDFGDLLDEKKWEEYKKKVLLYLKDNKIKPQIILTDLHPLFNTTLWGQKLVQKFKARHIPIQHHIAHIFSAIGDKIIQDTGYKIPDTFYGIACDGTGYCPDGKIWGGEVFFIENNPAHPSPLFKGGIKGGLSISRIGHLENQIMLGGDLAIREPARMLIGILNKVFLSLSYPSNNSPFLSSSPLGGGCPVLRTGEGIDEQHKKKFIYSFVKKYYSRNEFELLYNQFQQNFNYENSSSTGRILDAVSLLLGFCGNERNYKHEPIDLLEKNSARPYADLKPVIKKYFNPESQTANYELQTTPLFNYVINYLHKDRRRLAATAQLYIARGLYEIIKNMRNTRHEKPNTFFAGGIANNKIISLYLASKGVYISNKIPCGDAGLSFGQAVYYLLSK